PRTCLSTSSVFNVTAPPEIYTLSLHDALPISHARHPGQEDRRRARCRLARRDGAVGARPGGRGAGHDRVPAAGAAAGVPQGEGPDRKSTRLNSSHDQISYAVFCLKKKKKTIEI